MSYIKKNMNITLMAVISQYFRIDKRLTQILQIMNSRL